uniref:F-actin-capping protein subunit beta n=1 Tax=Lactuca sativa TaxID=4236 RepID=A0A9R1V5E9_LACSA|nr:hypothetical protein LSAT_V11C600322840 [Lactuca sativa]
MSRPSTRLCLHLLRYNRNAKWWYSAFHNVTAMVGVGVLSLHYALSQLGCYLGAIGVTRKQGSSLVFAVLSSSDVTDYGLLHIKECKNVEALNLNFCEHISDVGIGCIIGLSNLTSVSLKRNTNINAKGLSVLSGLVNLSKLDLERCSAKGLSACGACGTRVLLYVRVNETEGCQTWLFHCKQVLCDVDSAKEFILCDYNRDADSYTSPWSNKYHPPLERGLYPSPELRTLEIEANEVFSVYRDHLNYDMNEDGSKYAHGVRGYLNEGGWDAIHLIEVGPEVEGMADYCLTSTVMLLMTTDHENSRTFSLSGSIRRHVYDLLILIMSD